MGSHDGRNNREKLVTITTLLLDRDGVINKKITNGYVTNLSELEFIEPTFEFISRINSFNLKIGIITNQQCIAKGIITFDQLEIIHNRIIEEFKYRELPLPKFWVCPHFEGTCDCRKPSSILVMQALRDFESPPSEKVLMVGDSDSDVFAAQNANIRILHLQDNCLINACPAIAHEFEQLDQRIEQTPTQSRVV